MSRRLRLFLRPPLLLHRTLKLLFTHKLLHQFSRVREYIFLPTTATRDESFHKQVKMHLHSNRVYVWLSSKQVVSSTLDHNSTWSCMQAALREGALPPPSRGVGVPPPWVLHYRRYGSSTPPIWKVSDTAIARSLRLRRKGKGNRGKLTSIELPETSNES